MAAARIVKTIMLNAWLVMSITACGDASSESSPPLKAAGAAGAQGDDGCPRYELSDLCRGDSADQCKTRSPLLRNIQFSQQAFCFRNEPEPDGLRNVMVWQNSCGGRSVTIDNELGVTQYDFDADTKLIGVLVRDYTTPILCESSKRYGASCSLDPMLPACPIAAATLSSPSD